MDGAGIAGWYGKIPSLGDFASRRLPQGFIDQWDNWLQHAIATSRAQLGERWLDSYLTSPIWRFALMPGVCGASAWAGVMMPSVDRVGRHFPFTIALEVAPGTAAPPALPATEAWYAGMERAALAALSPTHTPDDLERALAAHPFAPSPPTAADAVAAEALADWWQAPEGDRQTTQVTHVSAVPKFLDQVAHRMFAAAAIGKSLWWTDSPEHGGVELHGFRGLPPETHFAVMMTGLPPVHERP